MPTGIYKLKGGKHRNTGRTWFKKGHRINNGRLNWKKGMKGYMAGEMSSNWKGGISFEIYPKEFNSALKLKIRTRDNFTCALCGKKEQEEIKEFGKSLSVNHINFNKKDCREENLNTLFTRCNSKINYDREHYKHRFNNKFMKQITIICEGENTTPLIHFLNGRDYQIFSCKEDPNTFAMTMIKREAVQPSFYSTQSTPNYVNPATTGGSSN